MTSQRIEQQRGQVIAFVVIFTSALLLMAGLVVDGGRGLSAQLRATDEAQAAARAGAEQINLDAYRADGSLVLDSGNATSAAQAYLAATGDNGTVSVQGNNVLVTVHISVTTDLLGIVGLHTLSESGSGKAQAQQGITQAGT
jgi:Flp pilus assembly protein TadG